MNPCTRHHEDLALLAGGDLPAGADREAAEAHVAACAACAGLFAELAGDRDLAARAARQPDPVGPSLVAPVLAHVAAEAVADGVFRQPVARRRTDLGLVAFGRIAAAVALVAAAGALGLGVASHEQAGQAPQVAAALPAPAAVAAPDSAPDPDSAPGKDEFRPVRVHRAAGNAVALDWESDGRESAPSGKASAYTVLASSSPRDFSDARPVLVAGRSVVASERLPAYAAGDRSLTFFRVE